jgi:hypothetical protein
MIVCRVSIAKLAFIYDADWMPKEAADRFKEAREAINTYLDGFTSLSTSRGPIGVRALLDVVIYGSLAHLKAEKVAILQSWRDSGIEGFVWAEFIVAAKRMCYYLGYLRDLNSAVLLNDTA